MTAHGVGAEGSKAGGVTGPLVEDPFDDDPYGEVPLLEDPFEVDPLVEDGDDPGLSADELGAAEGSDGAALVLLPLPLLLSGAVTLEPLGEAAAGMSVDDDEDGDPLSAGGVDEADGSLVEGVAARSGVEAASLPGVDADPSTVVSDGLASPDAASAGLSSGFASPAAASAGLSSGFASSGFASVTAAGVSVVASSGFASVAATGASVA